MKVFQKLEKKKGRPDILIYAGGIKLVIEGSYSKTDAEKDIKKKIENGFGELGIALHYKNQIPDKTESEVVKKLEQSKFDVKVFSPLDLSNTLTPYTTGQTISGIAKTEWFEVDVIGLSELIQRSYEFIVKEESVTSMLDDIEISTDDFVNRLISADKNNKISEKLYDIFYKLYGLHIGNLREISDLIFAQSFLTLLLSIAFYEAVQSSLGMDSLNYLISKYGKKNALMEAFKQIRKIDYSSIYDIALPVLERIPSSILDRVVKLGTKLGSDQSLLKSDFSGRIYHKIVGDRAIRRGFATFFTTIPASYLLAYLMTFSEFNQFKEPQKKLVCDFACGSGTLLTAIYSAFEDKYKLEQFEHGVLDLEGFHKKMLEKNFWGMDALRYALPIASLNLVFRNPTVPLNNLNFHSIPLGEDKNQEIVLGSLRFLKMGTITQYFEVSDLTEKISSVDVEQIEEHIPKFDFIIMNPPFTRATGRGGQSKGGLFGFIIDDKIRDKLTSEYERVREEIRQHLTNIGSSHLSNFSDGNFGGVGAAGEGLLFIYLAYENLKENGRIGFVLPKSFLTGASWFLIRTLLLEKFHLEYVVVSYDKESGYNFSESTNLSEVLIIAKKTSSSSKYSKFIMLLSKPKTSFVAKSLASALVKNETFSQAGKATAFSSRVEKKDLKKYVDNWGRFVSFPDVNLIEFILKMGDGKLFGKTIPITKLGKIADLGIDRHQFNDMFVKTNNNVPGMVPVIIGGEEEKRSFLLIEDFVNAVPNNLHATNTFASKSSILLVPDRIRLNTTHVIAMCAKNETLSNIFYAVRLNSRPTTKKYKALCVWINSIFGLLLVLSNREETEGAWIGLKMSHWKLQRVLDITQLKPKTIDDLAKIFDKYSKRKFLRLPQQFEENNLDPERLSLDKDVVKVLKININDKKLKELYKMFNQSLNRWF